MTLKDIITKSVTVCGLILFSCSSKDNSSPNGPQNGLDGGSAQGTIYLDVSDLSGDTLAGVITITLDTTKAQGTQ